MAYLSHLDLLRALARAFRRAKVALRYSQGFNPRPVMVFSPALAVGIESREEFVDFSCGSPLDPGVVARLNEVLPEGLAFTRMSPLSPEAPTLAKAIEAATYAARIMEADAEGLQAKVVAFNDAGELFIDKIRKERSVPLDLKRFVGEVDLVGHDAEGGATLRFPVLLDPQEGSVKPEEVLRGILGRDPEGASFVRERLHFAAPA